MTCALCLASISLHWLLLAAIDPEKQCLVAQRTRAAPPSAADAPMPLSQLTAAFCWHACVAVLNAFRSTLTAPTPASTVCQNAHDCGCTPQAGSMDEEPVVTEVADAD